MTPEQLKELYRGMRRTWDYVAQDLFCEPGFTMERDHVIEVVLDADYLEYHGGVNKDIVKQFRALSYDEQNELAANVFTARRYV